MLKDEPDWLPGSFTKNYGWGNPSDGLKLLHETIRVGFDGRVEDTPRAVFRNRIGKLKKPDYIPLQFFLFNSVRGQDEFVVADELVFQALMFDHSPDFDRLSLFAFLFSLVGRWRGASKPQRRPAEWARHYVSRVLADEFRWDASKINADSIEKFVGADARYKAKGARKLATNLNYLLKIGRIADFASHRVERWWVNSMFLALDRLSLDQNLAASAPSILRDELITSGFNQISGSRSIAKDIATTKLLELYAICGAAVRFSDEGTRRRIADLWPELPMYQSNDPRPVLAVSREDPSIQKTIPRICGQLAKEVANFEVMDVEEFANLNIEQFVKSETEKALRKLKEKGISPSITAEELMKITRQR